MNHPFADLIGLSMEEKENGHSKCCLMVDESLMNPQGVVHGGVIFSLADTGMGAALYPSLAEGEICATIEIKINYFRAVMAGQLTSVTEVVNRGKTVAVMESSIYNDDVLVARANGSYSIFSPGRKEK